MNNLYDNLNIMGNDLFVDFYKKKIIFYESLINYSSDKHLTRIGKKQLKIYKDKLKVCKNQNSN